MVSQKYNNLDGDIWTNDDDILLAEKVLTAVRNGNSVMQACREMEAETNGKRTASASKFRWHTRLKPQYQAGYELAKEDGKKKRDEEKRRINQGERYENLMSNLLDKDDEDQISLEDVYLVVKKYRDQENEKTKDQSKIEKENRQLKNKVNELEKNFKKQQEDLEYTQEVLMDRDKKYKKLLDSLKVLKEAGIQINVPDDVQTNKYHINSDGTIDRI